MLFLYTFKLCEYLGISALRGLWSRAGVHSWENVVNMLLDIPFSAFLNIALAVIFFENYSENVKVFEELSN